ncbi:MAG: inositol monophosphatase family protein [Paracoccaceae bacterium]
MSDETLRDHAIKIAELAEVAANRFFRGHMDIEAKGDGSPVTQADKSVEAEVREYLAKHFPDHGIFGEEHGVEGIDREHLWVVDPIDGTRSFLSGHPLFGFLLGHLVQGKPVLGIIGMPAMKEIFVGEKGGIATRNGQKITSSQQTDLSKAVLYINEGENIFHNHPSVFAELTRAGHTRRFGYDCYPHALLAMGHVDAVVDYGLMPYDYLAVSMVVEAAGGIMTDWQGNELRLDERPVATLSAATPDLHAQLVELVNR